jgi:hypothetical protein
MLYPDARVVIAAYHRHTVVRRSVVDDQKLKIIEILGQHRFNRGGYEDRAIIDRHEHSDLGRMGHLNLVIK